MKAMKGEIMAYEISSKLYCDYARAKLFVRDVDEHDRWMNIAFFAKRWGLKRLYKKAKEEVQYHRWVLRVMWKEEYDLDIDID